MAYWNIMARMPDEWMGQNTNGLMIAKQWDGWLIQAWKLLQGKGWAVICHRVKPQAHNT